ncbi:MGMT family protein [Salinivirga cyanobacteriivorans]|uniref:Methylated-DNA--protein-cysteine methyltransferase n=1 Tax=Salinivirga cyanobacteriivorans TaxID=1307839 RepID=A0A0S2HZW1_9BACT|nr:MGMT family protein [Salinivirga cyanobacteriivorans]ALO15554.1 Methylated-DNA--protein-cysteine methyltransferase [Salinivirga cyanobacteriivorans]
MKHFYEKVYEITRQVPAGKVTTYGLIARSIGSPQSARMVGWALNAKKAWLDGIPAHRVVNRKGLLTGSKYFPGNSMAELLENEGIEIDNNQIIDLDKHLWDPSQF